MKKLTYIDLFCGAGGMTLGFEQQGFENIFSVEYDKDFAETYKYNFPNHNVIVDDIKNISNKKICDILNNRRVDIVIGGPPCQGFFNSWTHWENFH
jgi:DNA (cytosine-5)-methyltransferase 1